MSVVFCGVAPHPPIIVPEVGKDQAAKVSVTQQAMKEFARRVKNSGADVLVIISPHGPVFSDAIAINGADRLVGDLSRFGAGNVSFNYANDAEMVDEIARYCEILNLIAVPINEEMADNFDVNLKLDHGVAVPLYFLHREGVELPLVLTSMGLFSLEELYSFGIAVKNAAKAINRKVAIIASGDLSHRLTPDAPAGYEPKAAEFDREVVRLVRGADAKGLINLDDNMVDKAGECGLRPIVMMMGALDGRAVEAEVLSYEGPFGVGYLVACLKPQGEDPTREIQRGLKKQRVEYMQALRKNESYLVQLARNTLENHVMGKPKESINTTEIPKEFRKPAATFVSIKKNGQLRGCIGTVVPQHASVVEEVIHNAVSAGIHDPRFSPVRQDELEELSYSVDVLNPPESVPGIENLDPQKYGVIVTSGHKRGLLLPNLEGVNTVQEQVNIAMEKAGILPGEKVSMERFEVIRYK